MMKGRNSMMSGVMIMKQHSEKKCLILFLRIFFLILSFIV